MGYSWDKVRKEWIYKFERRGRSYGGRAKTKAEATARRAAHRRQVLETERTIPAKSTPTDFLTASSKYLDYAKRQFVDKTYKQKLSVIKGFTRYLAATAGNPAVADVTPSQIQAHLLTRPSNNNYNVHRKYLGALFAYFKSILKLIRDNPVLEIPRLRHDPQRKYIPSHDDVRRMFHAARPRDRLFLMATLLTGARVDEIQRLTWADVDFEAQRITRYTRKRHGGQFAPISSSMDGALVDVLNQVYEHYRDPKTELVFPNPKTGRKYHRRFKMIKGCCRRAGIPEFTFHHLRHFMASFLSGQHVTTGAIRDLLGHTEVSTTERYLQTLTESSLAVRDAIEGKFDDFLVSGNGVGLGPKSRHTTPRRGKKKAETLGKRPSKK